MTDPTPIPDEENVHGETSADDGTPGTAGPQIVGENGTSLEATSSEEGKPVTDTPEEKLDDTK